MATVYKVLGQSAPSATTSTDVYTVPSETQAVISTIFVCNRSATGGNYRISIRPAGETLANKHYIVYDAYLEGNGTQAFTNGIALSETDVVTVYATTANFSFNISGSEVS